jgi:hypothetical protein
MTTLEKIEGEGVTRAGYALVKFAKLDHECQRIAVRERDCEREYYHRQEGKWFTLPLAWWADVIWDERQSIAE